jgi:metal-responsive CopG/Arc/MetJ family transcriptional regulator
MPGREKLFDGEDKNITIRLSLEMIARLDEGRRGEADIPNRSEMIRRFIVEGLDARNIKLPSV